MQWLRASSREGRISTGVLPESAAARIRLRNISVRKLTSCMSCAKISPAFMPVVMERDGIALPAVIL